MEQRKYQMCNKCVMDTTDTEISFDGDGVCNHCHSYARRWNDLVKPLRDDPHSFDKMIEQIKKDGAGKRYDCILGISGGVDSTYLALLTKDYGLRPLVIHLDNGWNSEIATRNINNIIDKLGVDLYTHVINWEEFRDLQMSLLKASVVDLELVSDHAVFAVIYGLARKYDIKYNLNGFNIETEGILPSSWRWHKMDWLNIASIHKKYGSVSLKTFPHLAYFKKWYFDVILKLTPIQVLNYRPYNKDEAKKRITEELGWQDYGGKHYESVITRFYQGYILPTKFNIDKRKAHLSTLINSGQITQDEALEELKKPIYDANQLKIDTEFVLKKLQLTAEEFDEIMNLPIQPHIAFPSYTTKHYVYNEQFFQTIQPATKLVKSMLGRGPSNKRSY